MFCLLEFYILGCLTLFIDTPKVTAAKIILKICLIIFTITNTLYVNVYVDRQYTCLCLLVKVTFF